MQTALVRSALLAAALLPAIGAAQPAISAFSAAADATPPAPWRVVGLPRGKAPLAELSVQPVDGTRALQLRTQASYGTLVHALAGYTPGAADQLHWRWRLDEPVAGADLRQRAGDDSALKLCLMFDLPLDRLGLWERNLLRLARSISGEALPAATLCYVWDTTLPVGTVLPNAYTRRVRFIVADGAGTPLGQWRSHSRAIAADFARAFGDESPTVPPLVAVVAGADADNTGARSSAWLGDVKIGP